jgi:hypothetical protein
MPPDLTEDDKAILVELLRELIERDRFPLPRIRSLKAILAKLDPPTPRAEPLPPSKPSAMLAKKLRR